MLKIFPEGSFILPGDKDSPRIALELPVSQDLAALTESAFIPGSEDKNNYGWNFSPIHRAEDGTYFFYSFSTWHFIDSFTVPIKYSFTSENPTEITITEIGKEDADYKTAGTIINALIDNDHTENAAIVPDGAQLGAFTHICDAVKIGDYYYDRINACNGFYLIYFEILIGSRYYLIYHSFVLHFRYRSLFLICYLWYFYIFRYFLDCYFENNYSR